MTREEAIEKLDMLVTRRVDRDMIDETCGEVIEYLESLEDEDEWIAERRSKCFQPYAVPDLRCACGSAVIMDAIEFKGGGLCYRIFCSNCGLQMRAAATVKGGRQWLRNEWREIVMRDGESKA